MPTPLVPTVPPGSGGGLFGGLRRLYLSNPNTLAIFGNPGNDLDPIRVHPGQVPPGTPLPYVVLSIVTAKPDYTPAADIYGNLIYLNVWYTTYQASVYAVGQESARIYADALHRQTDRRTMTVGCFECISYVSGLVVALDPKRSEDGREVWHYAYRYEIRIPEYMEEEAARSET